VFRVFLYYKFYMNQLVPKDRMREVCDELKENYKTKKIAKLCSKNDTLYESCLKFCGKEGQHASMRRNNFTGGLMFQQKVEGADK
jgi:hypothetical protein